MPRRGAMGGRVPRRGLIGVEPGRREVLAIIRQTITRAICSRFDGMGSCRLQRSLDTECRHAFFVARMH